MTTRTHAPTRRSASLTATAVALVLMLTGCMKVDIDLTLNEDETADGVLVMGVSDEVADMLGREPQELWDEVGAEMQSHLPDGATSEPYSEDGYTGARVTFKNEPFGDMEAAGATGDALTISREGNEYVVSGAMDMTDQGSQMDGMPESVTESFQIRVGVTFPGEVTEHNGTLDGRTVAWTPEVGERNEISARGAATTDAGATLSWAWLAVGALLLLVIAAAVLLARRARSRRGDADGSPSGGGSGDAAAPLTGPGAVPAAGPDAGWYPGPGMGLDPGTRRPTSGEGAADERR